VEKMGTGVLTEGRGLGGIGDFSRKKMDPGVLDMDRYEQRQREPRSSQKKNEGIGRGLLDLLNMRMNTERDNFLENITEFRKCDHE